MARFQSRRIGPFGGLNLNENPHAVDPKDLLVARNVVQRGETLGTRPGMILEATGQEYAAATTGGNPIQGLHEHRQGVDSSRKLLAVGNDGGGGAVKSVFYDDAQLLPKLATITGGQDNIWTFATHNDTVYAAGGLSRTDKPWYWAGNTGTGPTAISMLDSAAVQLYPAYIYGWRNYLFVGGLNPATATADNNASSVRYCDFATDPTVAANWKVGNTIGFTAYGTSYNTGMAGFRDNSGDFLMLLYSDHIQIVELDPTSGFNVPFFGKDKIANGCVSQRAYVSLGLDAGDAIYMSNKGIHTLKQSQQHGEMSDTFISWKIRPFLKTLNPDRLKYAVGAYDFKNGRVLFSVSTGSVTANDAILCLDVKRDDTITAENARWSIWYTAGSQINELKMLRDEDNVWRMYFGTVGGHVGYFDDETFSDFGTTYLSHFQTAHDSMGSTSVNKNLGDITITLSPGGNYTPVMRFHFDYGKTISNPRPLTMPPAGGYKFGTSLFGTAKFSSEGVTRDEKVYGSGSGKTIGFSVQHQGDPFWVSAIDYQVRMSGEDTGDTASGS